MEQKYAFAMQSMSKALKGGYFPALDGVRGWMAIGVLVAHVNLAWFPGAMILMELFFVISGFLITAIIWRGIEKHGQLDFKGFWKRRLARLYPVLILVVVIFTCIACIFIDDPWPSLKDALATLLYYSNWTKMYDYVYPTIFGQTWSLAVEEQFYLLWSLIFLAAFKLRMKVLHIALCLLLLALLCMAWKYYLIAQGAPWSRLYYALDTRMDAFVVGGLLALSYPTLQAWFQRPVPHAMLTLSACAYVILLVFGTPKDISYFYWQQTAAVLLSAMVVLLLASPRKGLFQWLCSLKPSVLLGERCYSIYLWHWPVIWLILMKCELNKIVLLLVVLPSVLLLSWLSYAYVEQPFMSKRRSIT